MTQVLVDGYNMAFRAFYGMPGLARSDGFPTGAIHGWVRTMGWIEDNLGGDQISVFFDLDGARRQLELRPDYKANRSETPVELEQQIPVIKAWTRAMGYGGIEVSGVEADDLIASFAHRYAARGDKVRIISADKDLCQLVTDRITVHAPPPTANPRLGWRELDPVGVEEKFGLPPAQIADYLALIGDSADNIPGLRGVGPKTAVKWLRQYGDLESIIRNCGELQPRRFQRLVHEEQEELRRNLNMTTLDCDIPIDGIAERAEMDIAAALRILEKMEMQKTAGWIRDRIRKRDAGA